LDVPPPQPIVNPKPMKIVVKNINRARPCLRRPTRQKAAAVPVIGKVIGQNGFGGRSEVEEDVPTEIVSCVVTADPEGVTCDGLKLQVAPEGKPEQLKLTAELKLPCGVTVSVVEPWPPELTVSELAAELSVKPPAQLGKLKEAIRVAHRLLALAG
jgi:hypothetical protein